MLIVSGCGGGGYGGGGMTSAPAVVTLNVSPKTIVVGQSATLSWSSSLGTGCTASGAWSGSQSASGTKTVTPAAAGSATFTLTCSGGAYASGSATATLTVNAASAFSLTNLVADTAGGTATNTDAKLVNPWGVSIPAAPSTAPAWVANNHTETSTLYDGNGKAQPHAAALVVNFAASASGTTFDPTGIVFNGSSHRFRGDVRAAPRALPNSSSTVKAA